MIKYLDLFIKTTSEAVAAIGMTEPGAGSDLQNMRMSAYKEGENYLIIGPNTFISKGQHCDVLILATITDLKAGSKGMTLFLLDCALEGFSRSRNLEKK